MSRFFVVALVHEGFGRFEPLVGQFDIHGAHLDRVGDVLDRAARKARFGLFDQVQIGADIGHGLRLTIVVHEAVVDASSPSSCGLDSVS